MVIFSLGLGLRNLAEDATLGLELGKVALFANLSVLKNIDLVALFNGGESMSNDDSCSSGHGILKGNLHLLLRIFVQGRSSLVEKKNLGLSDEGSGNGHSLLLAT